MWVHFFKPPLLSEVKGNEIYNYPLLVGIQLGFHLNFNYRSYSSSKPNHIPQHSSCILYIKYLPLSFKQILITMPLLPPFNTKTISARGIHILDQILQLLHGCG